MTTQNRSVEQFLRRNADLFQKKIVLKLVVRSDQDWDWSFIKSKFIFLTGKPTVPLLFQVCKTIPRCNSVPRKACKKIPRQHCQNLPKSKEAVKLHIFLKSNGISKQMVGTNHERPETKYLIWLPPQCFKVPRKTCQEFPRKKCKVSFHYSIIMEYFY